jgi:hypothetical protein
MTDNPYVLRLASYRLERDLTFGELSAQMGAAGYPVRERSLHLALTDRLQTGPRARTLYKITQFVEQHIDRRRKPAARKPVTKKARRVAA